MTEIFTIGDFCFRLSLPEQVVVPSNFLKFKGGSEPAYTYSMALSGDFPSPDGRVLLNRPDLLVTARDGLEQRWLMDWGGEQVYACLEERAGNETRIWFDPDRVGELICDPMFTSLLAMERRQLALGALILHCAFVEYQGEAILFSAPSETGKTTQANLWARHRGAETVNGDRGLLQKLDGRWYARGWPVCGSSGVCENRDVPIRAIVMLSQAQADKAERLAPMKAFTQLYSQITVNRWDRNAGLRAMELLEELISEIPVYHLACTMEPSAVEALEKAMN